MILNKLLIETIICLKTDNLFVRSDILSTHTKYYISLEYLVQLAVHTYILTEVHIPMLGNKSE